MKVPQKHIRESERLEELYSYSVLDTLSEREYDELTSIASEICGTPISLISLVDKERQWFKSHHGLEVSETPREFAFCAHAINGEGDIFVVEDARQDQRFSDNPLVENDPNVVFYAGVKLSGYDGLPLGTLCVIDHKPGKLTDKQQGALRALSNQVMQLLDLRRTNLKLDESRKKLKEKNEQLERFAALAAHDLKTPLGQISGMASLFTELYKEKLDTQGRELLEMTESSARSLQELVDRLLDYSLSDKLLAEQKSTVNLEPFMENIIAPFNFDKTCQIEVESELNEVKVHQSALERILTNLISNAYKYNDKDKTEILIKAWESPTHILFCVSDNGPGISEGDRNRLFRMFEVLDQKSRDNKKGHGIGLATVKKLVDQAGGKIELSSGTGEGCSFTFSLAK